MRIDHTYPSDPASALARLLVLAAGCVLLLALIPGALQAAAEPYAGPDAFAVMAAVEEIAQAQQLWPGYDPLKIPLAIYDGRNTYLFNHPAPPAGFIPLDGRPGVSTFSGLHDSVRANTAVEIGGVACATIMLPGMDLNEPRGCAAVGLHEMFHVFELQRHPGWSANEAELFTYPVTDPAVLAGRRMEIEALLRAVQAPDDAAAVGWAKAFLGMRNGRYLAMPAGPAQYERAIEGMEGLAHYVQVKAAGSLDYVMKRPVGGFAPDMVRNECYFSGIQLALLLDRLLPGWQEMREADDALLFDDLLRQAVAGRPEAGLGFTNDERDWFLARASEDIAALVTQREKDYQAFLGAPGWSLEVIAAPGKPLGPQGFDPLNLTVLDPKLVLHKRFLRLKNLGGNLEVLDRQALTESAGAHPLFDGVGRVIVTGLSGEPKVQSSGGVIEISAEGLKLSFEFAAIEQDGQKITLRLTE